MLNNLVLWVIYEGDFHIDKLTQFIISTTTDTIRLILMSEYYLSILKSIVMLVFEATFNKMPNKSFALHFSTRTVYCPLLHFFALSWGQKRPHFAAKGHRSPSSYRVAFYMSRTIMVFVSVEQDMLCFNTLIVIEGTIEEGDYKVSGTNWHLYVLKVLESN